MTWPFWLMMCTLWMLLGLRWWTDCDAKVAGLILDTHASSRSLTDCEVELQYEWKHVNHTATLVTACLPQVSRPKQLDICLRRDFPDKISLLKTANFTYFWFEIVVTVAQLSSMVIFVVASLVYNFKQGQQGAVVASV